jgi:uncharacterized protein YggU (UPF0235/DUF167 family)
MNKVDKIAEIVAEVAQMLPQLAAFEVQADLKQRVFNRGSGANGEVLNYKSEYYKNFRKSKGRQTDYIDFELTGKLRNSLVVGLDDKDDVAFGVNGSQNNGKSNEVLLKEINQRFDNFITVTEEERKKAVETAQRFFIERVTKQINEIR